MWMQKLFYSKGWSKNKKIITSVKALNKLVCENKRKDHLSPQQGEDQIFSVPQNMPMESQ